MLIDHTQMQGSGVASQAVFGVLGSVAGLWLMFSPLGPGGAWLWAKLVPLAQRKTGRGLDSRQGMRTLPPRGCWPGTPMEGQSKFVVAYFRG